jgi:hypothetical protein
MFWGFDQLDSALLHINIIQKMRNGYWSYKTRWNHPVDDFWEILQDGNPSLFRLPVGDPDAGCVDVTDFKREEDRQNKAFPASCGTWRSEQVQDFMDFMELSTTSAGF